MELASAPPPPRFSGSRDRGDRGSRDRGSRDRGPPRDRGSRERSYRDRSFRGSPPRRFSRSPPRRRRSRSPRRSPRHSRSPPRSRYRSDRSESPRPIRKKKKSNWDQQPDENTATVGGVPTAAQFVPGIQVQLPDGTQGNMDEMMGMKARVNQVPPLTCNSGPGAMHIIRQARRLYVGNLPAGTTQDDLKAFFNATMVEVQGATRAPGDSVLSVYINHQRRFGFIEFRTMEEATAAMALDGINFRGDSLRIGRPANYDPTMLPKEPENVPGTSSTLDPKRLSQLGIVSNQVTDGPDKIFCGGLPFELGEDQVKELASTYGRLKSFHLVKDMQTGVSKGFCFFKYQDSSVTADAIQGLNGIQIGDRTLTVRRHQPKTEFQGANAAPLSTDNFDLLGPSQAALIAASAAMAAAKPENPTNILCLMQMVTLEDLKDDEEYNEIREDTREECAKYGEVNSIEIPRPIGDTEEAAAAVPGVGKVFVEFAVMEQAQNAKSALEGRTFDNRTVLVQFVDPEKYARKDFSS